MGRQLKERTELTTVLRSLLPLQRRDTEDIHCTSFTLRKSKGTLSRDPLQHSPRPFCCSLFLFSFFCIFFLKESQLMESGVVISIWVFFWLTLLSPIPAPSRRTRASWRSTGAARREEGDPRGATSKRARFSSIQPFFLL